MFTFQELAQIVESDKRQASSQYYEEFRARGSDFLSYLQRKKKIDENVVLAVLKRVKLDPLVDNKNLVQPVNEELGRNDLTEVNIKTAMDQISYGKIRGDLKSAFDKDRIQYKESYLLEEMAQVLPGNEKLREWEKGGKANLGMKKRIFQTNDKRTVWNRFCKLAKKASKLGIEDWIDQTRSSLVHLLLAYGSKKIPNTTNGIERFFRVFNRFYKTRCGFFS